MVAAPHVEDAPAQVVAMRRSWWTRVSSVHVVILVAGALAFVANLAVLRPDTIPPLVAVSASDLLPGTVFDADVHIEWVPMETDPEVLAGLVSEGAVDSLVGTVVARPVAVGTPLTHGLFQPASGAAASRLMSVPIEVDHAAGGEIRQGDIVDVISVVDGAAVFVVTGIEVVRVPAESSGFGSGDADFLVVAVDATTALRLTEALDSSTVHVVRSTGAPPVAESG